MLKRLKSLIRMIYISPEEQIYHSVVEHARTCEETVRVFYNIMESMRKGGDYLSMVYDVFRCEKRADELRRSILEMLAKGSMPPLSREDFVRLVERMDMVADWTKEACRILKIFHGKGVPEQYLGYVAELSRMEYRAVGRLREAVEALRTDYRRTLEIIREIEEIEDSADDIYIEALRFLAENEVPNPMLSEKLVEAVENAVDACEDASDVLEEIVIRAIR